MIIKKITSNVRRLDLAKVKSNPLSMLFVLISLVVLYYASQFPDDGELGAGFFPIVVSTGIIVFAIADIVVEDDTELDMSDYDLTPPVIVAGLLIGYVLLMPLTGFLVGTMVFLPAILYYSNVRSKPMIAAISVVFPILLFYVFSRIFMVRLPEGIIPVSRLLPELPLVVV